MAFYISMILKLENVFGFAQGFDWLYCGGGGGGGFVFCSGVVVVVKGKDSSVS